MKTSRPLSRRQERLIALIILALLLFCPPALLIMDRLPSSLGWLPLYLFVVWGALIGMTAWLVETPGRR
ncbi:MULTISPECIES: hypothetical protein [Halomonadaceae]|jgi:hypothetical protein|uniref:Uncharacterized protein n=2 Tax=Halomonadaceae TaxID=28256 RepID=A0A8H9I524_9GAMM|nr:MULTISPECIES: hypothetical protein [Halomonas]KHJ51576.1 hypothetical protein PZ78_07525 [Halomonas hydrothermalis]MDM7482413.1 hypothetical protein [Halomonas sp.]UDM08881.1 hypothetical protein LG409_08285 [Halomonas sp. NyZ770]GGW36288.1 hypothetical protein GCM10007157_29630 [Halomonas hamiltonii]GGW58053.1 hypothetical protein GCM10007158_18790 [Halomonas johnsoniae]